MAVHRHQTCSDTPCVTVAGSVLCRDLFDPQLYNRGPVTEYGGVCGGQRSLHRRIRTEDELLGCDGLGDDRNV